jgi:alpha-L-rhamnosidase
LQVEEIKCGLSHMNKRLFVIKYIIFFAFFLSAVSLSGQNNSSSAPGNDFKNAPVADKPWVFWRWKPGAVSKQDITANLEAMQQAGIGGAYLTPIKDTAVITHFHPAAWWAMVDFAMKEAKRLHLQLAMHVGDGFALTGSPWIKPEMSMQKLVWTKDYVTGGNSKETKLEQPEMSEGHYKDIAVFAYPANSRQGFSDTVQVPSVTTSNGVKANFLCFDVNNKESFKNDTDCWIQYRYPHLFTCKSVSIRTGDNHPPQKLMLEACNDGLHFKTVLQLSPPQTGWQNTDEAYTWSIPSTTARYFRFVYDEESTEPVAFGKSTLTLTGIFLSDEPVINQYEGKNGSVLRIAPGTTVQQVTGNDAVALKNVLNLSDKLDGDGKLHWTMPAGNWVIVRIGHTSVRQLNETAAEGNDMPCDQFDPAAVTLQFNNWFEKAFQKTNKNLARRVVKIFHVGSGEPVGQNWSHVFPDEFKKRRGYDLMPCLLAITGVPLENAAVSEKILYDVRVTIANLVADNFYGTLKTLAHKKGFNFGEESAPDPPGDGMLRINTWSNKNFLQ